MIDVDHLKQVNEYIVMDYAGTLCLSLMSALQPVCMSTGQCTNFHHRLHSHHEGTGGPAAW